MEEIKNIKSDEESFPRIRTKLCLGNQAAHNQHSAGFQNVQDQ